MSLRALIGEDPAPIDDGCCSTTRRSLEPEARHADLAELSRVV
jgi:hypothetical protein